MVDHGPRIDARARFLTRRAVLGGSLAAGAIPVLDRLTAGAAPVDSTSSPARWRPWLLSRSDELRPVPPAAPSPAELSELITLQRDLKRVFDPAGLLNPGKIFPPTQHRAC